MIVTEEQAKTKVCCVDLQCMCLGSECMGWTVVDDGIARKRMHLPTQLKELEEHLEEGWKEVDRIIIAGSGCSHAILEKYREEPTGTCGRAHFDILVETQ